MTCEIVIHGLSLHWSAAAEATCFNTCRACVCGKQCTYVCAFAYASTFHQPSAPSVCNSLRARLHRHKYVLKTHESKIGGSNSTASTQQQQHKKSRTNNHHLKRSPTLSGSLSSCQQATGRCFICCSVCSVRLNGSMAHASASAA